MRRSVTGGKLERGTGVTKAQSTRGRSETGIVPQRGEVRNEQRHCGWSEKGSDTGRRCKKEEVTQGEGVTLHCNRQME